MMLLRRRDSSNEFLGPNRTNPSLLSIYLHAEAMLSNRAIASAIPASTHLALSQQNLLGKAVIAAARATIAATIPTSLSQRDYTAPNACHAGGEALEAENATDSAIHPCYAS
jgi:hypothetical protein